MRTKALMLNNSYKEEYENKYVAVNIHTLQVFDSDSSFKRLYSEIPLSIRERLMFFFVIDKSFVLVDQNSIDIYVKH